MFIRSVERGTNTSESIIGDNKNQYYLLIRRRGLFVSAQIGAIRVGDSSSSTILRPSPTPRREESYCGYSYGFRRNVRVRKEVKKWEQIDERETPMSERLELAKIKDLITQMVRKKMEVTEQDILDYVYKTKLFAAYEESELFMFVGYAHRDKKSVYAEIQRLQ
ncbi:MAG: hypothetical protein ACFFC7_09390 [Candidatus Hermodarchaeota archaeon]